jgi:hypothetical protein
MRQQQQLLQRVGLSPGPKRRSASARARVNSAQRIITALDFQIDTFDALLAHRLRHDPGYVAIQQILGVARAHRVSFGSVRRVRVVSLSRLV